MRFIVFGAGALGSLFGGLLSVNNDVLLVGREKHIDAIQRNGLYIEGVQSGLYHPMTQWDGSQFDVLLLTTKAYDTLNALDDIIARFENIPILSLQNGLSNEQAIATRIGEESTIGGVTSHGSTFLEDGRIFHAGVGETVIGRFNQSKNGTLNNIKRAFEECGITTKISSNINIDIWKKSGVNAAINGLTTILECKNGFILENGDARNMLDTICEECAAVAQAEDIPINASYLIEQTKIIARATANNISSMLQDILKGKKTEVNEIHGAFVDISKHHGIPTPMLASLFYLIRAKENVRHLGWPNDHFAVSRRGP